MQSLASWVFVLHPGWNPRGQLWDLKDRKEGAGGDSGERVEMTGSMRKDPDAVAVVTTSCSGGEQLCMHQPQQLDSWKMLSCREPGCGDSRVSGGEAAREAHWDLCCGDAAQEWGASHGRGRCPAGCGLGGGFECGGPKTCILRD